MKELKMRTLQINLRLSNAVANDDWKEAQLLRYQLDMLIDQMMIIIRKETTLTH